MKTINKYLLGLALPSLLLSDTMFVKQDANIRSNPDLKSKVIGVYKKNAPVDVVKKVYTKNNGTWYQTKKGYVSIDLISTRSLRKPEPPKEVVLEKPIEPSKEKIEITKKELFIDIKTDSVYTLIPKELIKKPSKAKLPPKPDKIYGNFAYAKVFEDHKQISSPKQEENQAKSLNYKYFVGISLGKSSFSIDKKELTGSIELNTPNNTANLLKLQGGVIRDNYIASINYERNSLDDLDTDALYLSLDHSYPNFYNIYVGLSLGYIQGKWNKDLLVNSIKTKDQKMSSYLYGLHSGWRYTLSPQWDFITQASYQRFELETDLISTPAKSNIMIDDRKSLEFGVRYNY